MDGNLGEPYSVSFPVHIQPGIRAGSWQVTFGELLTTEEFSNSLELLRWLEGLNHTNVPLKGGLR